VIVAEKLNTSIASPAVLGSRLTVRGHVTSSVTWPFESP